jgi:hypothetical protein
LPRSPGRFDNILARRASRQICWAADFMRPQQGHVGKAEIVTAPSRMAAALYVLADEWKRSLTSAISAAPRAIGLRLRCAPRARLL